MKKTWLNKLNPSILKTKTPLLGFTVLQVAILFVVINSGIAAVMLSNREQPAQVNSPNLSDYKSADFKPSQTVDTTPTQDDSANSNTSTQSPTRNTAPSSNDEWATRHDKQMEELNKRLAEQDRCRSLEKAANDKYSAKIDQAQAAYDAVMAEWDKVKDLPYYQRHPYEQYASDAKTKYNAISKPAYQEYVYTLNSLKAQGCQVIQLYTDTSWTGY